MGWGWFMFFVFWSHNTAVHLLCSAFGSTGSQMKGHQSLVRPLPSADIAEHRVSYTSALLGLCLQSESDERNHRDESRWQVLIFYPGLKDTMSITSKMIPLRTSFESTPTFRSSRHSLSNFSGVSLLSMLENEDTTRQRRKGSVDLQSDVAMFELIVYSVWKTMYVQMFSTQDPLRHSLEHPWKHLLLWNIFHCSQTGDIWYRSGL